LCFQKSRAWRLRRRATTSGVPGCLLLPEPAALVPLSKAVAERGREVEKLGFKAADALHVACAETAGADVLLSCDDRFCRLGKRFARRLKVPLRNPVDWVREVGHVADA